MILEGNHTLQLNFIMLSVILDRKLKLKILIQMYLDIIIPQSVSVILSYYLLTSCFYLSK